MTPSLTDLVPIPGRRTDRAPRILELDLSRGIVTAPPSTPLEAWRLRSAPTVRAVREGLRRAATDPSVAGLVVHVGAAQLTLAEADEMVEACERHHVKLAISHQTRYSPRAQRIKELIADGRLGDILELHGRGKEDARGGGQALGKASMSPFSADQACHAVERNVTNSASCTLPIVSRP